MNEVVMIVGYPASGKSELSEDYVKKGYVRLNRDELGKKVTDLLPMMEGPLKDNKSVVLDNTHPTAEGRKPFVDEAKSLGVPIRCTWLDTSLEDAQINALHRMFRRHGRIFYDAKDLKAVNDPNMFPVAVLFRYRKEFCKPTTEEGFERVDKVCFQRRVDTTFTNKAIIFDYDGTLRTVKGGEYKFPTRPEEVELLPNRKEELSKAKSQGYLLLGASNQSGIARGQVSARAVESCFQYTNQLLEQDIDYACCPHGVPPSCYCRKPQSGMGVYLIEKHQLNPALTIMVGDQTTDKTFAKRLGFEYLDQKDFFG